MAREAAPQNAEIAATRDEARRLELELVKGREEIAAAEENLKRWMAEWKPPRPPQPGPPTAPTGKMSTSRPPPPPDEAKLIQQAKEDYAWSADQWMRERGEALAGLEERLARTNQRLEDLYTLRKNDPGFLRANQEGYWQGQVRQVAGADLGRAQEASIRAARAAREIPGADALEKIRRVIGEPAAKLAPLLTDPSTAGGLLAARWAVARSLTDPKAAGAMARLLARTGKGASAAAPKIEALARGLDLTTQAGARQFLLRHKELVEADPEYRADIAEGADWIDELDGGDGSF